MLLLPPPGAFPFVVEEDDGENDDNKKDREVDPTLTPLLEADAEAVAAAARLAMGLTRQELADKAGVHYQTIGYLEREEYSPSLVLALRIAAALGTEVTDLFALVPFQAQPKQAAPNGMRPCRTHLGMS